MEKEFITYEQALALKELGFDEPCFGYRDGGGSLMIKNIPHCAISAPTFSQAFRWFREKYGYISYIKGRISMGFDYTITDVPSHIVLKDTLFSNKDTLFSHYVYKTYEEAESACLDKLIEIVKNK